VTINGTVTAQDVTILAFDLHGYFVASGQVQTADGSYQIQNLPAGDYYVMTMSQSYVDELYDNIPAPMANKEKWRQAKTVAVQDGAVRDGVNFDLQSGAVIEGRLFAADGTTPVTAEQAVLVLADATSGMPVMEQDVAVNDGYYQLMVPSTGKFKLLAMVQDFTRTWYPDKADVATATALTINSMSDVLRNVNFKLQAAAVVEQGGSISGTIKGKGQFFGALAGVAFAFDAKDTTLAGLGIGLLGGYTIPNLPAGNYIIFADDYLGNLIEGAGNFVGEFYENAYSVKKSKTVAVTAEQETGDIDFELERGGSITGKVTSEAGQALDSLMILAVNAQLLQGTDDEPLASSLHIAMCMTDGSGNYKMEGLPTGAYLVRTLSLVSLGIIFESPFIEIKEGKHNNKVVDVFYKNVANPLDYASAVPVSVTAPNATNSINFKLEQAKFIRGSVTDATNGQPVATAMIIAINDSSKNPYPALGQPDSDGSYQLGPLPRGKFRLLALTNLAGKDQYLSEYYDGKRDLASASVITVAAGDVPGINFTLDRGATIQGIVDLAAGAPLFPAGVDTLESFPVLVYNSSDGSVANYGFVQFNGGYRVDHLLPGTYKVLALPMSPLYAATYYGGGATFDDPACKTVTVNYGTTQDVAIELNQAKASISGTIMAGDTKKPLAMALAIAFDATGHPVGIGLADADLSEWNPQPNGKYVIPGLRKGTYYVRTFALTANVPVVKQLADMASGLLNGGSLDPMSLLSGDLFGNLNIDVALYQDQWYKNQLLADKLNLEDMVFKFSAYGVAGDYDNSIFPIYVPLPYFQSVPKSATPVAVGENAAVGSIDFTLWPTTLGGITAVTERTTAPVDFQMPVNYPNPFNPETTLSFSLPQRSAMTITVYDGLGRQVRQLANQAFDSGRHSMRWDGRDDQGNLVSSGVYIAVFATPASRQALKMIMLK
jgi:hypothetical protein